MTEPRPLIGIAEGEYAERLATLQNALRRACETRPDLHLWTLMHAVFAATGGGRGELQTSYRELAVITPPQGVWATISKVRRTVEQAAALGLLAVRKVDDQGRQCNVYWLDWQGISTLAGTTPAAGRIMPPAHNPAAGRIMPPAHNPAAGAQPHYAAGAQPCRRRTTQNAPLRNTNKNIYSQELLDLMTDDDVDVVVSHQARQETDHASLDLEQDTEATARRAMDLKARLEVHGRLDGRGMSLLIGAAIAAGRMPSGWLDDAVGAVRRTRPGNRLGYFRACLIGGLWESGFCPQDQAEEVFATLLREARPAIERVRAWFAARKQQPAEVCEAQP
jgi:hypothetical protein